VFISGEDTILDEPANPRKHDAMAAAEYLCAYIEEAFQMGTAFMNPKPTRPVAASLSVRDGTDQKGTRDDSEYVHLGPGAAA